MNKTIKGVALLGTGITLLTFLEEGTALGGGVGFLMFFGGILASYCGGSMLRYGVFFLPAEVKS